MADYTKAQHTFITHQALTHPGTIAGTEDDVSTYLSGAVHIYHANIEATANATGVSYIILISPDASGDESWAVYAVVLTGTSAAELETLAGAEAIGSKVLEVASTTNFVAGTRCYVRDTGEVTDGEWHLIENIVTNTSIDIFFGLVAAKDSADVLSNANGAEVHTVYMPDLSGIARVNVIVLHRAATGSDIHCRVVAEWATELV